MSLNRLSPEERMILERLRTDPEISFTEQQLQDMLDVELDKPADKMDLALVDEILAVLEPRTFARSSRRSWAFPFPWTRPA